MRDDICSPERGVLEQTLRQRVDELHAAVGENRVAINALVAEFGNWRKEPRLRAVIDVMQAELERHRQAIEKLVAESAGLREELARVKNAARPPR